MKEIVQRDNPILREKAKKVPPEEIKGAKIKKILKDMKEALAAQGDGVAIAAPQIGVSLRIFVVSGRLFSIHDDEGNLVKPADDLVFINPEILKLSRKKSFMPEGCLSVRWLYGKVERAEKARVRGYDEDGQVFEYGGADLLAQIFQHETDHLNGILFTDTAVDLEDVPPEKQKALKKEGKKAK